MDQSFTTQAVNFMSGLESGVDPRTGQFGLNIPLCNLRANRQLGPELDLSLRYSTLTTANYGFGTGFTLPFSRFDNTAHRLELSSGETYMTEPGSIQIKGNRLKTFIFAYTDGFSDRDGYTLTWKDGRKEFLKVMDDMRTFVTVQILSPLGRKLSLEWGWSGSVPLLQAIRDEEALLCSISYGTFTRVTLWPGTPEEYTLQFELERNDSYLGQVSRKVSEEETLRWTFTYDYQGQYGDSLLMTGISYPTGLSEQINYNRTEGHNFPVDAHLPWLPCVSSFIRNPGSNQGQRISYYRYTKENFLGYNGDFGNWDANRDYILTTLTDYTYGSEEEVSEAGDTLTVTRAYNNYHLLVSERTRRQGCERYVETEYYAQKYLFIDDQPPQFQLPRQQKAGWTDREGNSREELTRTEFDIYGNPTLEERPDGTTVCMAWYPAEGGQGCPCEPNGFTRLMKSRTVIPSESPYETSVQKEEFTYNNLASPVYIVQDTQSVYSGQKLLKRRQTLYDSTLGSREFGRITAIRETLYDDESGEGYTSESAMETTVENHILRRATTFTGHDGLTARTLLEASVYSGLTLMQSDMQGVQARFLYDSLGRPVLRTDAAGTPYEKSTGWEYVTSTGGSSLTQTDRAGNATRTVLDGLGRKIRLERLDADTTGEWRVTEEYTRNAFGETVHGAASDWMEGADRAGNTHAGITSKNRYDSWGERNREALSEGGVNLFVNDPVKQTRLVSKTQAEAQGISYPGNGTVLARYNVNKQPLSVTRLDADGNEDGIQANEYDGLGRLRRHEDEYGNATLWSYDGFGRVTRQEAADGSFVTKRYAPHLEGDFPESIHVNIPQEDGSVSVMELGRQRFDSLGRLMESTTGGRTHRYEYPDGAPVPSEVTTPAGEKLEYTYIPELDNAVRTLRTEGISQDFAYDPITGNLTEAIQDELRVARDYFPSGMLRDETVRKADGTQKSMSYRHSLRGAQLSFTDAAGMQTLYGYDGFGRLQQVRDPSMSLECSYSYDAQGRLTRQELQSAGAGQLLVSEPAYDDFSREVQRDITTADGSRLTVLQEWRQDDLLKEKMTLSGGEIVRREVYDYDNRLRLVNYSCTGQDLPPDAFGNRVSGQAFEFDPLNNIRGCVTWFADGSSDKAVYLYLNESDPTQLSAVTHTHASYPAHTPFSYDGNGRLTQDGSGKSYRYDALGRLTEITADDNTRSYGYDGLNRLCFQDHNGSDGRHLFYEKSDVSNELLSSGQTIRLVREGNACLGISTPQDERILLTDRHGSPIVSTLAGQTALHRFLPYGFSDAPVEIGFNGQRPDPFTGLYHPGNGYRQYSPLLMRFTAPDSMSPFGAGGINPYAYCLGNPVNYTDPTGHASFGSIFGIIVGIVGVLGAAFTGGASIMAAGGVMAALSSASAASLALGTLAIVSDVTAITAGALELNRHHYAKFFTWLSFGTGITGVASLAPQAFKLYRGISSTVRTARGADDIPMTYRRIASDRELFTIDSRSITPASSRSGSSETLFTRVQSIGRSDGFAPSVARPGTASAENSRWGSFFANRRSRSLSSSDDNMIEMRDLSGNTGGFSSGRQSFQSDSGSSIVTHGSGNSLRSSARSSESSESSGMFWDYYDISEDIKYLNS